MIQMTRDADVDVDIRHVLDLQAHKDLPLSEAHQLLKSMKLVLDTPQLQSLLQNATKPALDILLLQSLHLNAMKRLQPVIQVVLQNAMKQPQPVILQHPIKRLQPVIPLVLQNALKPLQAGLPLNHLLQHDLAPKLQAQEQQSHQQAAEAVQALQQPTPSPIGTDHVKNKKRNRMKLE